MARQTALNSRWLYPHSTRLRVTDHGSLDQQCCLQCGSRKVKWRKLDMKYFGSSCQSISAFSKHSKGSFAPDSVRCVALRHVASFPPHTARHRTTTQRNASDLNDHKRCFTEHMKRRSIVAHRNKQTRKLLGLPRRCVDDRPRATKGKGKVLPY